MPILNVLVKLYFTHDGGSRDVDAIHPRPIVNSPCWDDKPEGVLDPIAARTAIGRLETMRELSEAALFLLENGSVNGINLAADGGWTLK
jgi:hypothetical protein